MTYTIPTELLQDTPEARPGMRLEGDEWNHSCSIIEGDEFDEQFFGTNLRYSRPDTLIASLPVKVKITGRSVHVTPTFGDHKIRVRITTWDSNEEPVSFGGWLWLS